MVDVYEDIVDLCDFVLKRRTLAVVIQTVETRLSLHVLVKVFACHLPWCKANALKEPWYGIEDSKLVEIVILIEVIACKDGPVMVVLLILQGSQSGCYIYSQPRYSTRDFR
jgi:hypothetical protein